MAFVWKRFDFNIQILYISFFMGTLRSEVEMAGLLPLKLSFFFTYCMFLYSIIFLYDNKRQLFIVCYFERK